MKTLADVHFEMNLRGQGLTYEQGLPYETERELLARIALASPLQNTNESQLLRGLIWLGDLVAGLRCRLESRFASEQAATPC